MEKNINNTSSLYSHSGYEPPKDKIINYPYVISTSYYESSKIKKVIDPNDDLFETEKNSLKEILINLQASERKKEEGFIEEILKEDELLKKEDSYLREKIINGKTISKKIDLIEKYKIGLIQDAENLEEQLNLLQELLVEFSNEVFYRTDFYSDFYNFMGTLDEKTTVSMLIEKMLGQIKASKKIKGSKYKEKYNQYLSSIKKYFKQMAKTKFGNYYNMQITDLINTNFIEDMYPDISAQDRPDKAETVIFNYFKGIMNGLFLENVPIQNDIGFSTGRVNQSLRTLTDPDLKSAKKEAYAIKSDTIQLFNFSITDDTLEKEIKTLKTIKTNTVMLKKLEEITSEKPETYIVRISTKDYFKSNNEITINGEASFNKMLYPFYDIAQKVPAVQKPLENLIFMIANTGLNAIYHNNIQQIKDLIYDVCIVYMFEDYVDIFREASSESNNSKKLHVYLINGYFYAISDILQQLLNYINQVKKSKKRIHITLKPTDEDEFSIASGSKQEKWENVRYNTLTKSKLGIQFAYKELSKILFT